MCDSTNPQSLKDSLKFKKVFDDYFTFEDGNKNTKYSSWIKSRFISKRRTNDEKIKEFAKKMDLTVQ